MTYTINDDIVCNLTTTFTRRKSWDEVKETLGARQKEVMEGLMLLVVETMKPVSASELSLDMWKSRKFHTPDRNNVHPRLNELVALGYVEISGKRKCSITGKTVAVYKPVIR